MYGINNRTARFSARKAIPPRLAVEWTRPLVTMSACGSSGLRSEVISLCFGYQLSIPMDCRQALFSQIVIRAINEVDEIEFGLF